MSFVNERIAGIKAYFLSLPEVKRIRELEHYIDTNPEIQTAFAAVKAKQKQLVHAREFRQERQYEIYAKEYENLKEKLMDLPFVEEYLELLEQVNLLLKDFSLGVEEEIRAFLK